MKGQVLKRSFFYFAMGASLAFLGSCNKDKGKVAGLLPTGPTEPLGTETPVVNAPLHVFAGSFQVVNSGPYETLMRTCSRCGTKRLINTPWGTRYERYWSLGESYKECGNWLSGGFLQLEFAERKLPTSVKVLIQPLYRGSVDTWGFPFELTATAVPINKNQGFEIFISPSQGLGGVYNMILSSDSTNPVEFSDLSINFMYGSLGQIIAHPTLKKYTSRWVEEAQYSCREYTN